MDGQIQNTTASGFAIAAVALCAAAMLWLASTSTPANAANSRGKFTDDYCKQTGAWCGAVVVGNQGAYVLDKVEVNAKSSQPTATGQDGKSIINTECKNYDKTVEKDLRLGDYVAFVIPADCAYRVAVSIAGGPNKDENVLLTPGCQIQATAKGDLVSNAFRLDVKWTDAAKQQGFSGTVEDINGYKCGHLDKSGAK